MKPSVFWLCLLFNGIMMAQTCDFTLSGTIYDFHDNSVLEGVTIQNTRNQEIYYSDKNGRFSIPNLCQGEYEFLLSHASCENEKVEINITESTQVNWYMEHHIVQLKGVETEGNIRYTVATAPETHLHEKELSKYSAESLGTALKEVNGVSALETGNTIAKPMIHGLHSSRVLIINNGTRQEDMEWGIEHAPLLDVNGYRDVKVMKGASALRYGGDAIAGTVLAERRNMPYDDKLTGGLNLTGIYNGRGGAGSAYVQKKWKNNIGIQADGGYRKNGDYKAPHYYLANTGVEQTNFYVESGYYTFKNTFSVSYSYLNKKLGILKASHVGSLADLANAINGNRPIEEGDFSYEINKPYQEIAHHIAQAKWNQRIRNFGKLEANYAFQVNHRYEYDNRRGENKNTPSMDFKLTTHSGELFLEINRFKHWKMTTGINGMYQINFPNPNTQVKRLIPDYDKYQAGGFVSTEYKPNQEWAFSAGLRYDKEEIRAKKYYSTKYWDEMGYDRDFSHTIIKKFSNKYLADVRLGYGNLSSVVGAKYQHKGDEMTHQYALNVSQTNRAPNPAELFSEGLHHSAVSIELGDMRLQPEKSYKINANYQGNYIGSNIEWNVEGNAYFNTIKDFIYQIPTGAENTIRGAFPIWSFQQIDASFWGVDLELQAKMAQFTVQSKMAYLYAQDDDHKVPLIMMPPLEWNNRVTYQFPMEKYAPYLTLNLDYTARQTRYPDYDFTLKNIIENGNVVDKKVDISTPPPSYFLVGLEGGFSTEINGNSTEFNLRVTNLLNTSYRSYLNRFRYYADNVGRQIQVQIKYKF